MGGAARVLKRSTLVATCVAVLVASLGLLSPGPAGASSPSEEGSFVAHINSLRTSKGLAPLGVSSALYTNTCAWNDHMATAGAISHDPNLAAEIGADRKSTRLNSSHMSISYAVFCLKKK